jgi:hypothetical protein
MFDQLVGMLPAKQGGENVFILPMSAAVNYAGSILSNAGTI